MPETSLAPFVIRDCQIPEALTRFYDTQNKLCAINDLSRLNVFIGPNNSGKSRLLRTLFATDDLIFASRWPMNDELRLRVNNYRKALAAVREQTGARDQLLKTLDQAFAPFQKAGGARQTAPTPITKIALQEAIQTHSSIDRDPGWKELPAELKQAPNQVIQLVGQLAKENLQRPKVNFTRVYIPALRGLRSLESTSDVYGKRTVRDYFKNDARFTRQFDQTGDSILESSTVFTGLQLFDEVRKHLLGTSDRREKIAAFQNYLASHFFDGRKVTLIPREGDDVLHVTIGNEKEQPIYNLGDGIQQLIILTLPLFLHRDKNLLLFVEEPELYLHPGMQRAFIDVVLSDLDSCRQVFVATHAHQFLDITIDRTRCSVFKFTKLLDSEAPDAEARFRVEQASNDDFSLLQMLGVRNSSLLLSNCTIWVEGITDRLYLRRYFELFQEDQNKQTGNSPFLEDLHYSFVEYSGSTITHWSFLDDKSGINVDRVCSRLFLIADRDENKEERHKQLSEALGDRFYRLNCREIENLLTPRVISAVVRSYEVEDVQLQSFAQADYESEYLGTFIDTKVFKDESTRKRKSYADKSGTTKDKPEFCRRAISEIKGIEDVSVEAKELCRKLYEFIHEHNANKAM